MYHKHVSLYYIVLSWLQFRCIMRFMTRHSKNLDAMVGNPSLISIIVCDLQSAFFYVIEYENWGLKSRTRISLHDVQWNIRISIHVNTDEFCSNL